MGVGSGLEHEAVLYAGSQALLDHVVPFLREGIERDEPALVVLPKITLDAVRDELGARPPRVIFADMGELAVNPGRIIPAWRWFVDAHRGSQLRGVGEPVAPQHRGPQLTEIHRNESLVNVAFADDPIRVLCPYDVDALAPSVIEEVRRTHPIVDGAPSEHYEPVDPHAPFGAALADPVPPVAELAFNGRPLRDVREFVAIAAGVLGLDDDKVADLVLAVNEAATNSVQHGGGGDGVRIWQDDGAVVVEVTDDGWITEPLVGRRWPSGDAEVGRGLWIANNVSDLVQVHSTPAGTAVRLHFRL
jgi:anti-sigma regulatory factor (Ser/Thr protein kinase)